MPGKSRLEAFSDGVIAIIITIMVLEMKAPHGADWAALKPLIPVFLSYVLSFVYVGIYWNNHHHMIHTVKTVNGGILWANLFLLFSLSLVPFTTLWMGENHFAPVPTALYGVGLLLCAIAYTILQKTIIAQQGPTSPLARAVGKDVKGIISPAAYVLGLAVSFWFPWVAGGLYVFVAVLWLIPDQRLERMFGEMEQQKHL